MLDLLGKEIRPGQTVVYPVRQGSSMWMSSMKVTQVIDGEKPSLKGYSPEGRVVTIRTVKNAVIVEPIVPAAV